MRTLPCPLFVNAQQIPQQEAIVWGRRVVTWDQLNAYVHSTARYLKEIRVCPATHVAIYARNSIEYVITLLSLWRVGACVMPLSVYLPPTVMEAALNNFHPSFIFSSEPLPVKVSGAKTYSLSMLVSYGFTDGFLGRESNLCPTIDLDLDATVVLTSGSSSIPKGVLLSYGNFNANAVWANELIKFNPSDRWLLSLPLWHVSGLSIIFRSLHDGGTIIVPDIDETLETAMARYRPTHLSLVPMQLRRIMASREKRPGSFLKAILLGGAPIPTLLARDAVAAGLPLYATYGLTETASQVATGLVGRDGRSQARPLRGREVKISKEGEVLVRGAVLFKRYLFGCNIDVIDQDGWYHTADSGEIDSDGCLYIKGRMDSMFICGGENIYPETVEKALQEHPAIDQVVVVGVNDDELGQRPAAFVHFSGSVTVSFKELVAFLQGRLARHEIPRVFYAWPGGSIDGGLKWERKVFAELIVQEKATLISDCFV